MNFKPCAVIPIYNHKDTIVATVSALVQQGLPVFVIDDGSDTATQEVLAPLPQQFTGVTLQRLPRNRGKGGAVMAGMRQAFTAGFTHALQIDADGQHDNSDIPHFLRAAQDNPQALVCGQPLYDASVPRGRLYGRYITHFWVGIETLTVRPLDALCGFRVYPLQATVALTDRIAMGERMDFDPEILVRLLWDGVPAIPLPTRVIYPERGLSHFDYLKDNVRISRMHTRLVCGMLLRLPRLLSMKLKLNAGGDQRHWSDIAERGSTLGLRILLWAFRHGGRRACALLLHPVLLYFMLANRSAREASLQYWQRLEASAPFNAPLPRPGLVTTYRHFLAFGNAALDRVASWAGIIGREQVSFERREELLALKRAGKGAVLIGSHLGSIELCRAVAQGSVNKNVDTLPINVLVFTEHAVRFNELLAQVNPQVQQRLIQVSSIGLDTAILLKQKIDAGEFIVIVGDRTPANSSGNISYAQFLGAQAPFPHGPFVLAALMECPVYLLFCLREQAGYSVHLEHFSAAIALSRRQRAQRLQQLITQYAQRLEFYCRKAPMQWFNFYDFWQHRTQAAGATTRANLSEQVH
jgi:predicted LPLAT superfamily acyltransferase